MVPQPLPSANTNPRTASPPRPGAGRVDRTALKFNQLSIVALLLAGFVLNWPALVVLVCAAMLLGTAVPAYGPFRLFYQRVLLSAGIARLMAGVAPRAEIVDDDPAPHRFAMGMGAGCLVVAVLLFVSGISTGGWAVSWLVTLLAAVNLVFGFCAGCFVYFQLGRLGILKPATTGVRA